MTELCREHTTDALERVDHLERFAPLRRLMTIVGDVADEPPYASRTASARRDPARPPGQGVGEDDVDAEGTDRVGFGGVVLVEDETVDQVGVEGGHGGGGVVQAGGGT